MVKNCYFVARNDVDKLSLSNDLDFLGFPLEGQKLDKCNKKALLRRLAQHISSPLGIKTMALVCTTYSIYEAKFWETIINAMIKLKMVRRD